MSKKIVLPTKRPQIESNQITLLPPVEGLIGDALNIIQMEIVKFSTKTKRGQSLDLREARVLQGYIKSLVELSKEGRERDKEKDFSSMSDEQLIEMLQALMEKRKDARNNSEGSGQTE